MGPIYSVMEIVYSVLITTYKCDCDLLNQAVLSCYVVLKNVSGKP